MSEYEAEQIEEQHPAEKRIADREMRALKAENALLKADLSHLNEDQQAAVLALVKDDITPEAMKAKAESLGYAKPEAAAEPPPAAENAVLAAEERMSAAAADHAPPPPPIAPILAMREKVMNAPSRDVYPGSPLYDEVVAAFTAAGGQFVQLDHDGTLR